MSALRNIQLAERRPESRVLTIKTQFTFHRILLHAASLGCINEGLPPSLGGRGEEAFSLRECRLLHSG